MFHVICVRYDEQGRERLLTNAEFPTIQQAESFASRYKRASVFKVLGNGVLIGKSHWACGKKIWYETHSKKLRRPRP